MHRHVRRQAQVQRGDPVGHAVVGAIPHADQVAEGPDHRAGIGLAKFDQHFRIQRREGAVDLPQQQMRGVLHRNEVHALLYLAVGAEPVDEVQLQPVRPP